jgi:hypothetical protein
LKAHGGGDRLEARFKRRPPESLVQRVPGLLSSTASPDGLSLDLRVRELGPALHAFTLAVTKHRLKVLELSTRKATLEDLFLNLAGGRLNE